MKFIVNRNMKTFAEFIDECSVIGVREAYRSKHFCLKLLWIIFVIVGICATCFYIFRVVDEFNENQTATKISYQKRKQYPFPTISVCPPHWVDEKKLNATNLSQGAINYAFSFAYLQLMEEHCDSITRQDEDEFNEFMARNKIDNFLQLFDSISYDFNQIVAFCYGCLKEKFFKYYATFGLCYAISFKPTGVAVKEFDFNAILIRNLKYSGRKFLKSTNSLRVFVESDADDLTQTGRHIIAQQSTPNIIYIRSTIKTSLNRPAGKCVENSTDKTYFPRKCVTNCTNYEYLFPCFKCFQLGQFYGSMNNSGKFPLCKFCHFNFTFWQNECHVAVKEHVETLCTNRCVPKCQETVYDTYVMHNKHTEIKFFPKGFFDSDEITEILLTHEIGLNGVEVHQEYAAYSVETVIGNLGGVLGLWVGASIMTLIQIAVYCIQCFVQNIRCFYNKFIVREFNVSK